MTRVALRETVLLLAAIGVSSRSQSQTLHVQSELVLVPVNVINRKTHQLAESLTRDDFTLSVDGQPVTLAGFSRGFSREQPMALAVITDFGGIQRHDLEKVQHALAGPDWIAFAGSLGPNVALGLWETNRPGLRDTHHDSAESSMLQSYTSDPGQISAGFRGLGYTGRWEKPSNVTFDRGLADALQSALAQARALRPDAVREVIIVTEDLNLLPSVESEQLIARLQADGVVVSALQINNTAAAMARKFGDLAADASRRERDPEAARVSAIARAYASQTGGVFLTTSSTGLAAALSQLILNLSRGYILSFKPGGAADAPGHHRISVQLRSGAKPLEVFARAGYEIPPSS